MAVGVAALVAAVIRVRGTGGVPPHDGGWQELTDADLAAADHDDGSRAGVTADAS